MHYLMLIYHDESLYAHTTKEEQEALYLAHTEFGNEAGKRSLLRDGNGLMPTSSATTVRVRDGKTLVTDGPFAETKEQLGGYYLLDCKDLDEAIEMATKIPEAKDGSIEVRPIMHFE